MHAYFEAELFHHAPERNEVWIAGQGSAAAVWAVPGRWQEPLSATLKKAPTMLRVFGRRLPLAVRNQLRMDRLHPRTPEHWYLHYLGAAPNRQGQGLGSALMAPALERCDRQGVAAYLEASNDRNRALYERHGFAVVGEFQMAGGGPVIRRMLRLPAR